MANRARHAFGNSSNLSAALQAGTIDSYDILFLDGDTEPKVGWVDKQGAIRIVQDKTQIVRVDELPTADGDENVVYICNNEGYIWDGTQCVSLSKSADLTTLEKQVSTLETQMSGKVDASTVQTMVDDAVETAIADSSVGEVVEF